MEMEDMQPTDINTSLLNQSPDPNNEGSPNKRAEQMKKKIGLSLLTSFKKKKVIEKESIYNCKDRKV